MCGCNGFGSDMCGNCTCGGEVHGLALWRCFAALPPRLLTLVRLDALAAAAPKLHRETRTLHTSDAARLLIGVPLLRKA